jgi:hypothetical protein
MDKNSSDQSAAIIARFVEAEARGAGHIYPHITIKHVHFSKFQIDARSGVQCDIEDQFTRFKHERPNLFIARRPRSGTPPRPQLNPGAPAWMGPSNSDARAALAATGKYTKT